MSESEFREAYRGTAVLRAKRSGLARNAAIALGNIGDDADLAALGHALESHDEALVRSHAAWALGRIGGRSAAGLLDRVRQSDPDPSVRAECVAALEHEA
jgi:epoxyqueuosine reductase